jgi:hypothetical protein
MYPDLCLSCHAKALAAYTYRSTGIPLGDIAASLAIITTRYALSNSPRELASQARCIKKEGDGREV